MEHDVEGAEESTNNSLDCDCMCVLWGSADATLQAPMCPIYSVSWEYIVYLPRPAAYAIHQNGGF